MKPVTPLPVIILAAGLSSRMRGRDKLLEMIDGVPLLLRQSEAARSITKGPVIITLPPEPHPRHEVLKGLPVTRVPVANAQDGLSESLRCGLSALPSDAKAAMLLLADLPELTAADLATGVQAADLARDTLICRGTTEDGAPGHPIIVSNQLFEQLKAGTGDTGGSAVMKAFRDRTKFVPLPGRRALCDLDTPEDWEAWRRARGETQ